NSGVINANGTTSFFGTINNLAGGKLNLSKTPFSISSANVNNSGLISADSSGAGSIEFTVGLWNSGTINVAAGSTFAFSSSPVTHYAGSVVTGAGFVELAGSSTITHLVTGPMTLSAASMRLSFGTISGDGDVNLTTALNWAGGTIAG